VSRVHLFGLGTKSESWAITAQRRINFYVEQRHEADRTAFALVGRAGLTAFVTSLGLNTSRGMWAVNTLTAPMLFSVHANTLYSINNAGITSVIGTIGTSSGDVSMVDDGTNLMLVDGTSGYYYNMLVPAGLNLIVDGNFTTSPSTVTWQDTYFIVTSNKTNQFQLSTNSNPATWPAVQINFTGSAPGTIRAGIADHSTLMLYTDVSTEFWQDTGSPDFPYALIPGTSQEYGLAAPWSMTKYENSVAGLFHNKMGSVNVSKLLGFTFTQISSHDVDEIISAYPVVADAKAFAYKEGGHPFYLINFPSAGATHVYDDRMKAWMEFQDPTGANFWGLKFANFNNQLLVSDYRNGNIYKIDPSNFTDNGTPFASEVTSKHIWDDDKYLSIPSIQVDFEQGTGPPGPPPPVVDLQVSKDGGNSFTSIGFSSIGMVGQYTQRVIWRRLGRARDWVLKLRVTDPVKRVITGASAIVVPGTF
jgi:hypothetical protein